MADKKSDPRHEARILVLQKLFERNFVTEDISKGYDLEFDLDELQDINIDRYDEGLFNKLLNGTINHRKFSDKIIEELAPQWPIEMINMVDLQILRMAIFEGFISQTTPVKVVLNEAIDLAKEFGGSPSGKFINGVLGNLMNNEKLQEKIKNYAKKNKS
jgi:N utilization substance protein B